MTEVDDINAKLDSGLATLDEVSAELSTIGETLAALKANGHGASQDELAVISSKVEALVSKIGAVKSAEDAIVAPPAHVEPQP